MQGQNCTEQKCYVDLRICLKSILKHIICGKLGGAANMCIIFIVMWKHFLRGMF